MIRALAVASYPPRMAATRFRMERYVPHLAARGIEVELVPWLDDAAAARLYRPGGLEVIARGAAKGALRQLSAVAARPDVLWVQREAMLVGPPVVEALARLRGVPIVYDYDDAVWMTQGGLLRRAAKLGWKFDWMLSHATHALAGSQSLARRATRFGVPVSVAPTVVEREVWRPREPDVDAARPLVIGWIGTQSTAPQLAVVAPALRRLRDEGHAFRVVVIGAGPDFALEGVDVELRPWALEREIEDFRSLDIGVAPMFESEWHEGKCGFKQIQLMAVGVPFVSSLVGGARDFLVHDENALIARTEDDWYAELRRLMIDPALRSRLGRAGRAHVERELCTERQVETVAHALRTAAERRRG